MCDKILVVSSGVECGLAEGCGERGEADSVSGG
jgi:hypothetical protein